MESTCIGLAKHGRTHPQQLLTVEFTDQIYHQAYKYLKVSIVFHSILTLTKIIAFPYYLIKEQEGQILLFLAASFSIFILQAITSKFIYSVTNNMIFYYQIARATHHSQQKQVGLSESLPNEYRVSDSYDFTLLSTQHDEEGTKKLASSIKHHLINPNTALRQAIKIQILLASIIHIWGILLLTIYQISDKYERAYIMIVIAIGVYQYQQPYFDCIIAAIQGIYRKMKLAQSILKHFIMIFKNKTKITSRKFNETIKGNHQCNICLTAYQKCENIIVLKCSQLHNFHEDCLRQWIKRAQTCPLCRRQITFNN